MTAHADNKSFLYECDQHESTKQMSNLTEFDVKETILFIYFQCI